MRSFLCVLILAMACACAQTARVENVGQRQVMRPKNTASTNTWNLIEGSATNGSPSVTIGLGGAWEKLRVAIFTTYVANTYVTLASSCSLDGTNSASVQTRSCSSGTCTLSTLSDYKALGGADQDYMVELDVLGCQSVTLTLGGDNTDVADLQAIAVR